MLLRNNAPLPVVLAGVRVAFSAPSAVFTASHRPASDGAPATRQASPHVAWVVLSPWTSSGAGAYDATGALALAPGTIYVLPLQVDTSAVREAKVGGEGEGRAATGPSVFEAVAGGR